MPDTMTVNSTTYEIVRLLGKGKGGYSYLVKKAGQEYVLKQIHHEPCAYYQFGDKLQSELNDYNRLQAVGIPMPRLLDVDFANERILKEYIPGVTVYDLVRDDRLTEWCIARMEDLCLTLYAEGLNIDYFPTNFIPADGELFYVDYECNPYMEEWNFANWGVKYWSRTPEFLQHLQEHP